MLFISVLLDIHGMRAVRMAMIIVEGSRCEVGHINSPEYTSFDHWNIGTHWAGEYDITTGTYLSINHTNIAFSLSVVEEVVLKYKGNPNVVGIEPANEPWANIPIDVVKQYYWDSYNIVR